MSKYPLGATWQGTEIKGTGRIALIWLERIYPNYEVWKWEWAYSNGRRSGMGNWGKSYQSCRRQIPFNCKMKRI